MEQQTPMGTIVDAKDSQYQAWVAREAGGPLQKVGIRHPELKDDEIIVDIEYTGICQSDVGILSGHYGEVFPAIAGHEIAGVVAKVGKDVPDLKVGDHVGIGPLRDFCGKCEECKAGKDNLCTGIGMHEIFTAMGHFGGWANSIQIPHRRVVKIPAEIALKDAPSLMCAGITVYSPIKKYGGPGKKCAIIGIGGLGHLAVQFASKMGMKVYAVSSSEDKKADTMKLGAHEFVAASNKEQLENFQKEKIDVIIGTLPHHNITPYVKALRPGTGVFVMVGATHTPLEFSLADLIMGEKTVTGSAASNKKDHIDMLHFAAEHKVVPIAELYAFDDFQKAYNRTKNEKPIFRCVVDVKGHHKH